ncbi:hypothetical protein [Leeuwenhoekiella aestuarii]|uniref:hypothetical protein n=1 Tax=Leeuwenhoekiella aestuarii TaxID=2249426 RepID=UPI000FFF57BE|nr:hypothetical protein [Leeuwenhoekiella aestuarii]
MPWDLWVNRSIRVLLTTRHRLAAAWGPVLSEMSQFLVYRILQNLIRSQRIAPSKSDAIS